MALNTDATSHVVSEMSCDREILAREEGVGRERDERDRSAEHGERPLDPCSQAVIEEGQGQHENEEDRLGTLECADQKRTHGVGPERQ